MVEIQTLGAIELSDSDGQTVRLDTLWAEKPHILVFLRHFG